MTRYNLRVIRFLSTQNRIRPLRHSRDYENQSITEICEFSYFIYISILFMHWRKIYYILTTYNRKSDLIYIILEYVIIENLIIIEVLRVELY